MRRSDETPVNSKKAREILGWGSSYMSAVRRVMGIKSRYFFLSDVRKFIRDNPTFTSTQVYPLKAPRNPNEVSKPPQPQVTMPKPPQSESAPILETTLETTDMKPKTPTSRVPFGVWFDKVDGNRVRFDRVHLLFVLPKFVAPQYKKGFETVRRNVENAAAAMPDVEVLVLERGWGKKEVAKRLKKHVRKWLKGVGRPPENS